MQRMLIALAAAALVLVPTAANAGEEDRPDDLIVLTGHGTVAADERVDTVVVFDGEATIDGTVDGSVVLFNAPATITGTVAEDVISFHGTVRVEDGATIEGDLVTRTEPVVAEGATVGGEIRRDPAELFRDPFPFLGKIAVWLAVGVSSLVLGFLLLLLAPRGADRVSEAWRTGTGPAIGWGLLLLIGLPLAAGLSLLTILALPLGFGVLFALGLIYATGYVAGAWIVGRALVKEPASRAVAFLAGLGILRLIALVPFVSGIVGAATTVIGLGAIAVAIWRSRRSPVPAPA